MMSSIGKAPDADRTTTAGPSDGARPAPGPAAPARLSWRDGRIPVVLLGLMFLPAGLQAAFLPRGFFDDFPLGRRWIGLDGSAYNEHLVRDVGGLFLALVVVSLWAWRVPALCRPVAVAWLIQGVLHLVHHSRHLDGYGGFDKAALVGSLIIVPVLALAALASPLERAPR